MDRGLVNATGRARGRNDAAYPAEIKGAAQGIITCPVTHRGAIKMLLRPGNSRPPRCGARAGPALAFRPEHDRKGGPGRRWHPAPRVPDRSTRRRSA